jgi:hypothetical protein
LNLRGWPARFPFACELLLFGDLRHWPGIEPSPQAIVSEPAHAAKGGLSAVSAKYLPEAGLEANMGDCPNQE